MLFAAAVTFFYYGRFMDNYFVFDDYGLIEHVIEGPAAVLLGYGNMLRFVVNSVWWPLYRFSGFDPFGYNLFSAVLYLLNPVLLYFLIAKLFNDRKLAFLAGVIFAAGGIGADAVLWKAANGTLLNLFFYLLTLYTYIAYRQSNRKGFLATSLTLFLLATFTKEESASLPLIIVLIEALFFNGLADKKGVIRRIAPYCAIIVAYLLVNYIVIYHIVQGQSELVKHSRLRPLWSLFAPWTVFFLSPDGLLQLNDPRIYITALLIPLSFLLVREKKLLLFGYGWVFLAFLPQSLSTLSRFDAPYIFNSISRHLYVPSVGSSFVFSVLLLGLKEKFSPRVHVVLCTVFVFLFISLNYKRVRERGEEWREHGEPMARFLYSLKEAMPEFPENSYVHVIDAPVGRAYVQQSLRAFYQNPKIFWVDNPNTLRLRNGEFSFLIVNSLEHGGGVGIYRRQ